MDAPNGVRRLMAAGLALTMAAGMLAGCSSPEERAAEAQEKSFQAQERVANERLSLIKKYQECAQQAGADTRKREACDSYLKSAEALK